MESISHPECSLSSSWLSWFLFSLFRLCSIWILRLSVSLTRPMLALWRPFFSAKGWNSMGLVGAPLRKQGPAEMGAGLSGPLTLPNLLLHETILLGGLLVKKWPSQTSKLEVMRNLPNISDLGIQTYWPIVDLLFAIGRCPSDMLGWKPNKLCYFNSLKKTHWICGMFLQWHNFEILIFFRHATTNPSFSVGIQKKTKILYRIRKTVSFYCPHRVTFTSFNAFRSKPRSFLLPKAFFFQRIAAQYGRTVFWTKTSESENASFFGSPFYYPQNTKQPNKACFMLFLGAHFFTLFQVNFGSKTDWNTYTYILWHIVILYHLVA